MDKNNSKNINKDEFALDIDVNPYTVTGQSVTQFNVINFGAIGDGVADDTLAIQKAVSQALNARGTVYIPNGKYRITATINCMPVWGTDAGAGKGPNGETLSRSGCSIIGEHRRGTIIYADFDNWQTTSISGQNVCQYYLTNGTLKPIVETQYGQTQVNLTTKIVFYHAEYMHFSDMWIVKKDTGINPDGVAFSTPYNTQTAWSSFERITIELFNYGFWHRFSLYNYFSDILIQNCRIGIRLARIDDRFPKTNNNNPPATTGWNSGSTGWFHNVLHFNRCTIKGNSGADATSLISSGITEIGFWGSPMATVFTSCSFENIHRNTQAVNNTIAPPGTPGTGIYIEDGLNTGDGRGVTVHQFYTEVTERPIYCTDIRDVNINGGFMQGAFNNTSATSPSMEFNNCLSANITGNIIIAGAFNNFVKATNNTSVSYDNFTGGKSLSGNFSPDATSKINQTSFTSYLTTTQLNTSLQTKANTSDVGAVTSLNTINKTVVPAINEVNQNVNTAMTQIGTKVNTSDVGTVTSLNTTNKTIVPAINEVNQNVNTAMTQIGSKANASDVGAVTSLNTTNKTVVPAINEVNQNVNTINQNVNTVMSQIGTKANTSDVGVVTSLNTASKTVVLAINELNQNIDSVQQKIGKVNTNIQITSPQSKWYGKTMNCLGDSITYGLNSATGAKLPNPWVDQLKVILNLAQISNYGISSTTVCTKSSDLTWNTKRNPMCLRYANMSNNADIVSCLAGINDFWLGVPLGTFNDTSTDTFYGGLHQLYSGLVKKYLDKAVFVMTCLKVSSNIIHPQGITLKQWTDAQREVAEYYSLPVLDLYKYSAISANILEQKQILIPDGLHPNQAGSDILARKIAAFIETL